ncbi:MAG: DUF4202 domain-containing protein [Bacteroidota bacterium]
MQTNNLHLAFQAFDQANAADPNQEEWQGGSYAKELLYAQRTTRRLNQFFPEASHALQLAARAHHICRWEISRSNYPQGRKGYNQWRAELRSFHAEKAASLLQSLSFEEETIARVKFLILKKQLKRDAETQALEDVICLVFLEHYFLPFAAKHSEEKVIDILQKTWRKMSKKGQAAALELPLHQSAIKLIKKALATT